MRSPFDIKYLAASFFVGLLAVACSSSPTEENTSPPEDVGKTSAALCGGKNGGIIPGCGTCSGGTVTCWRCDGSTYTNKCTNPCGEVGEPCCNAPTPCYPVGGSECSSGECVACGGVGQPCCSSGNKCGADLGCINNSCQACGKTGEQCCPSSTCSTEGDFCEQITSGPHTCQVCNLQYAWGTCTDANGNPYQTQFYACSGADLAFDINTHSECN